ncbi:hypothetical protein EVAR_94459_1 [Eumeta japonica]|uniref:Uncharacterized protein n=1 Tax=Eumeta variegata TaxID=151549 RepID=A0A4C1ZP19_EUMVA|nr:hypothetical protein EVAR_94459_1 [Eumeta japonica]
MARPASVSLADTMNRGHRYRELFRPVCNVALFMLKRVCKTCPFVAPSTRVPRNILFRQNPAVVHRPTCRGFHLVPAGPEGGPSINDDTESYSEYGVEGLERLRPLVVRLAHRVHRKQLVSAVRRSATTAGLGLSFEERRLYVNKRDEKYIPGKNTERRDIVYAQRLNNFWEKIMFAGFLEKLHHSVDILAINETWLQLDEKDKASIYPAILSEASPSHRRAVARL